MARCNWHHWKKNRFLPFQILSERPKISIFANTVTNFIYCFKPGDRVAFYDNCEIREGTFLCSSLKERLDAQEILASVLTTEEELRLFCRTNNLGSKNSPIFSLVVEAYKFLKKNAESTKIQISERKRPHDNGNISKPISNIMSTTHKGSVNKL